MKCIRRIKLICHSTVKKAAKYASPISIMGFADFETKLECINSKDKSEDMIEKNQSFTTRKIAHKIVSFSLIFVDTDGKLILKRRIVVKIQENMFPSIR